MCSQGLQRDNKSGCEWKELSDFCVSAKNQAPRQRSHFASFFAKQKGGRPPQRAKPSCYEVSDDETKLKSRLFRRLFFYPFFSIISISLAVYSCFKLFGETISTSEPKLKSQPQNTGLFVTFKVTAKCSLSGEDM